MSLEVKACAALTEPERAEILALQNEVYSGENLKNTVWLQTESHFDRTVPCFYLGRENDALTAFLSLFLPTQEEAEVTAFTKQSARNCGQFTALLHAAAKEMQVHGVPDFLFDLEPQSETGKAYLKKHFPNAVHSHTEYRMTREPAVFPLPENITVKCVTGETLADYLSVSLQLHPAISIITNIDADHLDYFGTLDNIVKSFHQFCLQTSKRIIVNADNANAMRAVEGITNAEIVTFGRTDKSDYYVTELNEEDTVCEDFTVMYKGARVCRVSLRVPGEHNMMNALAAAAAAHGMGVDGEHIKKALEDFSGVHRRFEILGKFEGVTVADDFAHHPTELSAVLSAAVRMGYHEVWAVFQPHTYSRTAMLLDDFAKALSIPQHVVMTEILAVRETNTYNIHTSDLAAKIPGSCWFGSFEEIADYVMTHAKENDLILTLGGGDIYKCANLIVEKYKERA